MPRYRNVTDVSPSPRSVLLPNGKVLLPGEVADCDKVFSASGLIQGEDPQWYKNAKAPPPSPDMDKIRVLLASTVTEAVAGLHTLEPYEISSAIKWEKSTKNRKTMIAELEAL